MKVLLLSAYDAASHQQWYRRMMAAFNDCDWTLLALPARYFSWRVRGNSLSWAFEQREVLERDYDLVIATSMVDLSALRGFVPALSAVPTLVYFHENQFEYPASGRQFPSVEPQILSLYTALAADYVVFNSHYNRDTFLQGAKQLLGKLPDHVPKGLLSGVEERSSVLAVPIALGGDKERSRSFETGPLKLLWNHRWEYDKAPERLFSAVKDALEAGASIELYVLGQRFREVPDALIEMKAYLERQHPAVLRHWGFVEDLKAYRKLLATVDIVLSTALHDFQGLAVLEAVAAGCLPLVPNRLCYPEWFDDQHLYYSSIEQPEMEAEALAAELLRLVDLKAQGELPALPDIAHFSMASLKGAYEEIFKQTIIQHGMSNR